MKRQPHDRSSAAGSTSLLLLLGGLAVALAAVTAAWLNSNPAWAQGRDTDGHAGRGIVITIDPDDRTADDEGEGLGPDRQGGHRERDIWDMRSSGEAATAAAEAARERARELRRQAERLSREAERSQRQAERLREVEPPEPPRPPRAVVKIGDRQRRSRSAGTDSDGSGPLVRMGRNLRVGENDVVESVVVLGGNLVVEGEVEDDAVVIGGHFRLEDGGVVGGDAVVIGGRLDVERGGYVDGDRVEIGNVGPWAMAFAGGPGWGGRQASAIQFFSTFLFLLIVLFLGWLANLLIGDRLRAMSASVQSSFLKALLVGLLVWILWIPALVIFAITIIGIPVTVVLAVAVPLAGFIGFLAGALALGQRVATSVRFETQSTLGYLLVGVTAIGALSLLANLMNVIGAPLRLVGFGFQTAGCILTVLLSMVGLGALLLTRFGRTGPAAPVGAIPVGSAPAISTGPLPPTPPPPPAPAR